MSSSSIEVLDQNDSVIIPYHTGLSLGQAVDFRQKLGNGEDKNVVDSSFTKQEVDQITCKYSLPQSLTDVSQVLDISPQYLVRVRTGLICNDVVSACLQEIGSEQEFKLIIRVNYLKETLYNVRGSPTFEEVENDKQQQQQQQEEEKESRDQTPTHEVSSVALGEELVVIVSFTDTSDDPQISGQSAAFRDKMEMILGDTQGVIEKTKIVSKISDLKTKIELGLKKNHYRNVRFDIKYGAQMACGSSSLFSDYLPGLDGMVSVFKQFISKWNRKMTKHDIVTSSVKVLKDSDIVKKDDSQPSTPNQLFKVSVTLRPVYINEESNSTNGMELFNYICSCLDKVTNAKIAIESFLSENSFSNINYIREGEKIKTSVGDRHKALCNIIHEIILLTKSPMTEVLKYIMTPDIQDEVDSFIRRVQLELPTGSDLDFLLIGKTGHGKSSTGMLFHSLAHCIGSSALQFETTARNLEQESSLHERRF